MVFFFILLSCTLHVYVDNGKGNQSFNSSRDGQVGSGQAVLRGRGAKKGGLGENTKEPARNPSTPEAEVSGLLGVQSQAWSTQ